LKNCQKGFHIGWILTVCTGQLPPRSSGMKFGAPYNPGDLSEVLESGLLLHRVKPVWIILTVLLPFGVLAQNGDCATALSVCNDVYSVQTSPAGTGAVFEMAPGTCNVAGEFNSAWYVFTAQETGPFGFVLNPNNLMDDYDWSVYNITTNGCAGISSGISPEVSCNSFGLWGGIQGPTGISSAMGGFGNSNGPGDINGPPFNANLQVTAGQVYALVVMNFSATLNGYTLDFTQSQVSIFDDEPPAITSVVSNCSQNQFTVTLSEGCRTSGMTAGNITLTHNGQVFPVTSVSGVSGNLDSQFVINVNGLGALTGDVTIDFNNALTDLCDNELSLQHTFTLPGTISADITTTPSCSGEGGGLTVVADGLGTECYVFTLNGASIPSVSCNTGETGDLAPGTYTVVVNGQLTNCPVSFTATVNDLPVQLDAGGDQVLCDMNTALDADAGAGEFAWLPQNGITFGSPGNPSSSVSADAPGTYELLASLTQSGCTVTDGVSVTFNFPPDLSTAISGVSCFGTCDGGIAIENASGPVQASIGGAPVSGEIISFDNLCADTYDLVVIFSPECTADYEIEVESPPQVVAQFEADPWRTNVNMTEIDLLNTSLNADSVVWTVLHDMTTETADQWTLQLPVAAGAYAVTLTAYGENGCADSFTGTILVEDNFQVFVPNAFSPDGDGINDAFLPRFSYAPERYELLVFNRWGDVIFRTVDPAQAWTGNVHGGEHYGQGGVYLWRMVVKGSEVTEYELEGHVVMIR
jgi:gliding motility-associated-like protein